MNSPDTKPTEPDKASLELQRLNKEVEKLGLEVESLKSTTQWDRLIGRYLPITTALLAIAGFWVGIYQSHQQKKAADMQRTLEKKEADEQRTSELHREAARPFWDTQLALYIKAADAAATIATTKDRASRKAAEDTFWNLYWGPLSCVEDITVEEQPVALVEAAMVRFGDQLSSQSDDTAQLPELALAIAHAVRQQIGPTFNLKPAKLSKSLK